MSDATGDVRSSLADLAEPFPPAGELTAGDLPEELCSRFEAATVVGLGEASHGTQEFFDLRFRLVRLLVEEFGVRAIGFEATFDPMVRVDDLVAAGEGEIRSLVAGLDVYRPFKTETMVALFEWLQSYNASRPPGDRVHVYGFDTTVIEAAATEIEPYLDRVGADVDESLREDLDTMRRGYDGEDERQALLEGARRAHARIDSMLAANESAWVEATSRRAYEGVRHRLDLVETQIEAHGKDHEERMALRDEAMAANAEWIQRRAAGPVVLWGANGHLNRHRHVLDEWDVDVPSMGSWLADAYKEAYCPVAFELGGGEVAALDAAAGEVVDYPIPAPPSGSIPDLLRQVDEPVFCLSVDDLRDDPSVREWLSTQPPRHNIWGGHPDGEQPVRYQPFHLEEFDWVVFVRDTSPLVHLD